MGLKDHADAGEREDQEEDGFDCQAEFDRYLGLRRSTESIVPLIAGSEARG